MKKERSSHCLWLSFFLSFQKEQCLRQKRSMRSSHQQESKHLVLIPLVLVLVLLFKKVDMIIAGLIAGILAMIIGGISLAEANSQLLEAIPTMLSITVPIINSAVAMAVFKAGSYTAALTLAKRGTKGKVEYVAGFIVILLAAATYMSGIGGGEDGDRTVSIWWQLGWYPN